jgi:enterochelin esterase-like enzyme
VDFFGHAFSYEEVDVRRPFSVGRIDTSLDNLIGKLVAPVIVPGLAKGCYNGYIGANRDKYLTAFTEDLIPFIDQRYRTLRKHEGYANCCTSLGGFMAFYASTQRPDLFGVWPFDQRIGIRRTKPSKIQ